MATKEEQKAPGTSGFDKLREEAVHYLGAQVEHLVDKAGEKVSDLTGRLGEVVENGGALPKSGARALPGAHRRRPSSARRRRASRTTSSTRSRARSAAVVAASPDGSPARSR
ncbi:hypothetical protein GCM10025734_05080 [Kitasatospora paranensis]|uniref:hypothetical protein n=1 Tax=Kitasatospora paranensis TaxID=258053 RepID=UPI0033862E71